MSQLSKIPDVSPTHLHSPVAGYPSLVPGMYGGHMKSFVLPSNAATQSMSWINATMNNNGSGPNQRGVYNSVYFRTKLTDIQIQAMFDYLGGSKDEPTLNYSQTLLQLDSYGGQINKYNGNDTSIKQRSSIMKGQFQTYWNNGYDNADELDSQYINWQKEFFTAMFAETGGFPDPDYIPPSGHPDPVKAKASVDGCYVNYPNGILGTNGGTPSIDHALKLYFGDAITKRLMSTKTLIDPNNFFQHSQSIPVDDSHRAID
ncbi:MAG: BBE domain-containing protein [Aestuariivita sp.]|nr:BBE domain-containing protein [Aestuariivita sp.]